VRDNIRSKYGQAVARELLDFSSSSSSAYGATFSGLQTSTNYSHRALELVLFINHRLVESRAVRAVVQAVYEPVLPRHGHPFVYLDLRIDPANIDVNVHPTKREVHFMHEEEILELVRESLEATVATSSQSRTYRTHTIPGTIAAMELAASQSSTSAAATKKKRQASLAFETNLSASSSEVPVATKRRQAATATVVIDVSPAATKKSAPVRRENRLVRTDSKQGMHAHTSSYKFFFFLTGDTNIIIHNRSNTLFFGLQLAWTASCFILTRRRNHHHHHHRPHLQRRLIPKRRQQQHQQPPVVPKNEWAVTKSA
jgi:DNA mismatch repair ATPase MutL